MWTPERITLLKRYWAEGASASEIAALLGGFEHCTDGGRNAVIGKVHRLKFDEKAAMRASRPRDINDRIATVKGATPPTPGVVSYEPKSETMTTSMNRQEREPSSLDVPLIELRQGQCRWPHGEGPYLFCGHPTVLGERYCPHHTRRAARPLDRRERPFMILSLRKVPA